MPRLFVALPVPDDIADELTGLQSGVPDARWVPPENFHVTLCFAGEVQGGVMRDLEEELSDAAGPKFTVQLSGVEQFSSGKQPRALVALVEELRTRGFPLVDCQQRTPLLSSLGAREIPRADFLRRVGGLVHYPEPPATWTRVPA